MAAENGISLHFFKGAHWALPGHLTWFGRLAKELNGQLASCRQEASESSRSRLKGALFLPR